MIRKYLSLMCAALMIMSLAACGNDKKKGEPVPVPETSTSSEATPVESSEPEVPTHPEMETTPVSDKNIYDSTDMEFVVDGVKVNFTEILKDTTHNVLFLENVIEIPVMQMTDTVNTMLYNIVLSKEELAEKTIVTTVGQYKVYVDAFDESFTVAEIAFAEGVAEEVKSPTISSSEATEASRLPETAESSAVEAPASTVSAASEAAAPATDVTSSTAADAASK